MKVLVPVEKYAAKENISRQSIYNRIKSAKLKSVKINNKTYIVSEHISYNPIKLKKAFLRLQDGLQQSLHKTQQTAINKEEKVYNEVDNDEKETKKCKRYWITYIFGFFLVVSLYFNYRLYGYLMSI